MAHGDPGALAGAASTDKLSYPQKNALRPFMGRDSAGVMNWKPAPPPQASLADWLLLAVIVAFGGSAFVMIRAAVETIAPAHIAVGRLWIGALVLYFIMRQAGRRLPPVFVKDARGGFRLRRSWRWMVAVGFIGNTLPFFIFPWAQQYVESGLAGVYMAFMPLWTLALAYIFAGEGLTPQKFWGFLFGFLGVLILIGPEALKGVVDNDVRAQAGLLFSTLLYAASAVIARRAPPIRPRVFAAGMMIAAAVAATPALLFLPLTVTDWSAISLVGLFGLGLLPTGVNGVLIIILIRRAGAGFMALTNYFTPLWAVAMGAAIYQERLAPSVLLALGVILCGVALSRRGAKRQTMVNATPPAGVG